jgi:DeoR/GlpR family transcriptional regulator of sugar metabolism
MLYNERAELILQQLQLQSTVKVQELSQLLQVSVDTVRRDLKAMEQEGLIKCLRGGACLPESLMALKNFKGREVIHSDLKQAASRKALGYIKAGDIVAMNSGTTNTILAQELLAFKEHFTVVTNNFAAANILMQNPSIRLIFIGGMMDALEQSTYGSCCEQEFAQYFPDICFLSVNAVNYQDGYTDFRMNEIPIIRLLAASSRRVIAVMDSSKLGKCSKKKVLEPEQVDVLLMDGGVSQEIREKYGRKGIRIE